jgi:hypothetical protein
VGVPKLALSLDVVFVTSLLASFNVPSLLLKSKLKDDHKAPSLSERFVCKYL